MKIICLAILTSAVAAAICHESWGSRPEATSLPPSILLFSVPSRGLRMGLGKARSPAAKHFSWFWCNLCSQTVL